MEPDVRRSCTRKRCYSTEALAVAEAHRKNYDHSDVGLELCAYGCHFCGFWHIGRAPGSPQIVDSEAVGPDYSPCPELLP